MKFFENAAGYIILALLIIGQCIIRVSYLGGQFVYLAANALALVRCFYLNRQKADKVKEACCGAITLGLIGLYLLG